MTDLCLKARINQSEICLYPKEPRGPFVSSGGSWSLQFRLRCALELLSPGEPGKLTMTLLWEWVLYTFLSLEAVHFLAKNDPPWAHWTPRYSLRLSELSYPAALSPHSAPPQPTICPSAYVSRRVMIALFCRQRFRQNSPLPHHLVKTSSHVRVVQALWRTQTYHLQWPMKVQFSRLSWHISGIQYFGIQRENKTTNTHIQDGLQPIMG